MRALFTNNKNYRQKANKFCVSVYPCAMDTRQGCKKGENKPQTAIFLKTTLNK